MNHFNIHTAEDAPVAARDTVKMLHAKMGMVPNLVGVMAESPVLLKGWVELKNIAEHGLFSPVEREIVQMTVSYLNDCGYCMAAHTAISLKSGLQVDIIEALRHDKPLKDAKLEQLHLFTKAVMKRLGRADVADIDAFIKAGYTQAHVLEVVLGISLATLTNYTNHIAQTPVDTAFDAHRVERRIDGHIEDKRHSSAA
ncbi:MAG: carboxymuconolactone decarboxylase family protein [Micavibrio sp.]|nr:carboxymuconolactone decarboxylase family protein [Micavibrio sp.]